VVPFINIAEAHRWEHSPVNNGVATLPKTSPGSQAKGGEPKVDKTGQKFTCLMA